METIIILTENERQLLQFSLPVINKNMDFLVVRFYAYLLNTKAGVLFQNTNIQNQHKMFASSLNIIITNIVNPQLVSETLDQIIKRHENYGVTANYIEDFIDSFQNALNEVFSQETDKLILRLWIKIIDSIMMYFKEQI